MTITGFDYKKTTQVINYFAEKEGGKIDKLKLIKLVWLVDRYHLRKYGRIITNDTYFAMQFGPVPSAVKDLLSSNNIGEDGKEIEYFKKFIKQADTFSKHSIKSREKTDLKMLSKSEIKIIDLIHSVYGKYNNFELAEFSHHFPEWKKFKIQIESGSSRELISFDDFFSNPLESEMANSEIKENIFNELDEDIQTSLFIFNDTQKVKALWSN